MRVKISDVLWFQEGPGVRNTQYTESGVKLLNVANLVDGNVDISNTSRYISEEEAYGKYKHFLVDEGDFIIASSGIKVEYFDKKMGFVSTDQLPLCMNTSTIRFKVLDSSELNIRYFMYYLKSDEFKEQLARQITGSAQLNFGPSHLKKMTMPIVGLAEQDDLVSKLDFVDSLITARREQLAKLDELVKSRFIELFGSVEDNVFGLKTIKIKDACDLINGKAFKPEDWSDAGLPIVRIQNLNNEQAPFNYFDGEIKEQYLIDTGELLFSWSGTPGTSFGAFFWNRGKAVLNQHIFRVRLKVEFNLLFLQFALNGRIDYIISKAHGGVGLQHITKKELDEVELLLPSVDIQNQFADFVEQTDKSKFEIQQSLEKLETLKKTLMQKYFG